MLFHNKYLMYLFSRGRHGHDHMVVGFTMTNAIHAYLPGVLSSNPAPGEVFLIQHYVIMFVNDLWQVSGFL
jgi:multisubunit Na+/H+ antiporter MnhE subunit